LSEGIRVGIVRLARDGAAWVVQSSDIPGLWAQADTLDELFAALRTKVAEEFTGEWHIEAIAHETLRVSSPV